VGTPKCQDSSLNATGAATTPSCPTTLHPGTSPPKLPTYPSRAQPGRPGLQAAGQTGVGNFYATQTAVPSPAAHKLSTSANPTKTVACQQVTIYCTGEGGGRRENPSRRLRDGSGSGAKLLRIKAQGGCPEQLLPSPCPSTCEGSHCSQPLAAPARGSQPDGHFFTTYPQVGRHPLPLPVEPQGHSERTS